MDVESDESLGDAAAAQCDHAARRAAAAGAAPKPKQPKFSTALSVVAQDSAEFTICSKMFTDALMDIPTAPARTCGT